MSRSILFLVPVLLVAGLVYVYGPWSHDSKEQSAPHDTKPVEPRLTQQFAPADPVSVSVPKVAPEPIPDDVPLKDRTFMLPDGTMQPVLNAAYGAPKMIWPRDLPYSRIVRTVRDANGLDWYEHEDGSMSITQIVLRKELGRMEPITNVFNPAPTVELGSEQEGSPKSR